MCDLGDLLLAWAEAGNFTHLSIVARKGEFAATFTPSNAWGQGHGTGGDPVTAAVNAIGNAPKGRRVQPSAQSTKAKPGGVRPHVGALDKGDEAAGTPVGEPVAVQTVEPNPFDAATPSLEAWLK